ncbi:MAG: zeta toxin family protein [Gammaproteobacteria bacterium]
MNRNASPQKNIGGYAQLKKLRTALAISQGIKLLSVLQQEAEATISHDQTKRVTYLTELFSRIHREMFHDWKEQAIVSHRPGSMPDPTKRKIFRKTISRLVLDSEGTSDTAIFDNNGFVIDSDNIAERLADFYRQMRSVRPFAYGNRITLDFFMVALGKLPSFKAVYNDGIDFRRLAAEDAVALHNPTSRGEEIVKAFAHALDPTRNKRMHNRPNDYGKWPENKTFVSGIPFLSHKTASGVLCVVTVNGGLVPVDSIQEEMFIAGKQLADYPVPRIEHIIGYLPGTEALRTPGIKAIDGIEIAANGAAPLFCLDVNILTGLRAPSHTELLELLKQCGGINTPLSALVNNSVLRHKMLLAAEGDKRLERGVEIACERLAKMTQRLDAAKDAIFAGKSPVAEPRLFMCMGGAGAGKTLVEELAQAECGDNFVIASLDEFRKKCDLYGLLTAAEHHSDDYIYVEPFANRLRDMVAEGAKAAGFNILYDATGIPYKPRYSGIVEQFKKAGFRTQIVAVDAFIVKPQGREDELQRATVIGSVKDRFERTGRALPWVVAVYKHIRSPEAFLYALEDRALDKISLFANDGARNQHYLVAESFDCSEKEMHALQQRQKSETLAPYLKEVSATGSDSTLKNLAQNVEQEIAALLARNPVFTEDNVAYQIYPGDNRNRVLMIYNTGRWVDFVEKRQLNPNASGEPGLLHKSDALAFHVDPNAEKPCIVRLRGSLRR